MTIREIFKSNQYTSKIYTDLKNRKKIKNDKLNFKYHGNFVNRASNYESLLIILAGYKSFLYPCVFERIKRYTPHNVDVCIISSGKFSSELDELCKKNNWSYLSTKENNVSLVQNVAISLHPKARYIYKLDEDIFITKGYFDKLKQAYVHASYNSDYRPGIIAPVIPLNAYAHMLVLDKLNLRNIYEQKFEKPYFIAGNDRQIENNPDVAKFFWGEGKFIPHIDKLNALLSEDDTKEAVCPIRFSIGAIMFERNLWEKMGHFRVNRKWNQMGEDEIQICSFCMSDSRPIFVSKNVAVGHFSFGPQTEGMKKYYKEHPEMFEIKEV